MSVASRERQAAKLAAMTPEQRAERARRNAKRNSRKKAEDAGRVARMTCTTDEQQEMLYALKDQS